MPQWMTTQHGWPCCAQITTGALVNQATTEMNERARQTAAFIESSELKRLTSVENGCEGRELDKTTTTAGPVGQGADYGMPTSRACQSGPDIHNKLDWPSKPGRRHHLCVGRAVSGRTNSLVLRPS